MRIATFNVENMFERAKALNLASWADGKPILEDFGKLNELIQEPVYTPALKKQLLKIMGKYKGLTKTGTSEYLVLREVRGSLVKTPTSGPSTIVPDGRADWVGWFDLNMAPVGAVATENVGRVIGLIHPDVLALVEVEDRPTLKRFNAGVLPPLQIPRFDHVMLIDGNDDRGIDVGVMSRSPIVRILSHVDDTDAKGVIFSRDCVEYELRTPGGNTLLLLVNHFKSKGYGAPAQSDAKRLRQAKRARTIYDERRAQGYKYVALLGDLNEIPANAPLDPLLREGSDLIDIMAHAAFTGDGFPGTHGNGGASAKLDYILMSPELSALVTAGGVERSGVWGGKNGSLFPHMPTIKKATDAASDHAALWVEALL
jgi:endonuclease/exonuclease/phosphatase family metal-dependent hydrolase